MKPIISTSAYWNGKVSELVNDQKAVAVGITIYPCRQNYGYKVAKRVMGLAPTRSLFSQKELTEDEYTPIFWQLLEDRWAESEQELLSIAEINPDKEIILLCFENVFLGGEKGFCHRTIVNKFIAEKWGVEVQELPLAQRKTPPSKDEDGGTKQLLLC